MIGGQGFARPNRYRINISGNGPTAAGGFTMPDYSMMCESVSFPGQNMMSSADTLRFGPEREFITGVSYGPINATFICSPDMREKRFFERWQEQTMDLTTWEPKYYSDYIGGMKIYQLDRDNAATYVVELFEVYPKTITEQSLGYATNDSYQTISIELEYHHWKYANERSPKKRRPRRGRTGGGAEEKDTTAYVDDFSSMPTGDTTGGETDPGTAYVDDYSNMPSEGFVDQSRSFQHGAHNRLNQRGE